MSDTFESLRPVPAVRVGLGSPAPIVFFDVLQSNNSPQLRLRCDIRSDPQVKHRVYAYDRMFPMTSSCIFRQLLHRGEDRPSPRSVR